MWRILNLLLTFAIFALVQGTPPTVTVENYDLLYSYYTTGQSVFDIEDVSTFLSTKLSLNGHGSPDVLEAMIYFVSGFVPGDILDLRNALTDSDPIYASYDYNSGILRLTGIASINAYMEVLRDVTFEATSTHKYNDVIINHSRTLGFIVINDSGESSNLVTRNVRITSAKWVYTDYHRKEIIFQDP